LNDVLQRRRELSSQPAGMVVSRTIIVAGAGIGGLTAALALAAKGFRIVVLEKAERLEQVGAGLQISPNASRILIDLGLEPGLAPRLIVPEAVSIISARTGREIGCIPLGEAARFRYGAPYWILHRADLQAALLARVRDNPDIDLRLGAQFEDIATYPKGITVVQRKGNARQHETALALIGADGVWSTVRHHVFPKSQAIFTGRIAWRGTVDARQLPREFNLSRVQLWLGPNAHLVAYPVSGGQRINVVAVTGGTWNRPGWNEDAQAGEIQHQFALRQWPISARMLVGAVEGWRRWALFAVDGHGPWVSDRVALLGDAAHAMLPFVAQGAGMAIEDAAVLADCLAPSLGDPAGIAAALLRYEATRKGRVVRVQRTAQNSGRIYHLRGPMALARDTTIRLLGHDRLLARQDWIYDWRAH
jgi:salicylate hydroxylase